MFFSQVGCCCHREHSLVYLFERPVTSRDNDVLYFSKHVIFQDEKLFVNNESLTTLDSVSCLDVPES